MKRKIYYGWWITLAAFCTFGISTGISYYNLPFFYDYFEKYGWTRADITPGVSAGGAADASPAAPLLAHRFSPRE